MSTTMSIRKMTPKEIMVQDVIFDELREMVDINVSENGNPNYWKVGQALVEYLQKEGKL